MQKLETFNDRFPRKCPKNKILTLNALKPRIKIFSKFRPCHFFYFIDPQLHAQFLFKDERTDTRRKNGRTRAITKDPAGRLGDQNEDTKAIKLSLLSVVDKSLEPIKKLIYILSTLL